MKAQKKKRMNERTKELILNRNFLLSNALKWNQIFRMKNKLYLVVHLIILIHSAESNWIFAFYFFVPFFLFLFLVDKKKKNK